MKVLGRFFTVLRAKTNTNTNRKNEQVAYCLNTPYRVEWLGLFDR